MTPEQINAERERRKRARQSLLGYSLSVPIPGVPLVDFNDEAEDLVMPDGTVLAQMGKLKNRDETTRQSFAPVEIRMAVHHAIIMSWLERVMLKPRGRGMCFAPPGSAKSTYGSVVGPSWYMGKFPASQIILASYGSGIACKQSRKVRAIVRDPLYSSIWPERPVLNDDQRAIDDWSLSNGSSMMAAGILAGITGNRADGVVLDDLIRNREEADSPTICDKVYAEYVDTVLTRAKPRMWVVGITTRWSEIDWAGCILPTQWEGESGLIHCRDGQMWDVLSIPAEADRIDDPLGRDPKSEDWTKRFLWPEWFPREHWSSWRDNPRAKRTWGSLFQQQPAPGAGILFQREKLDAMRYDPNKARGDEGGLPRHMRIYGASDYATRDVEEHKKDPDFTEHGVWGMCEKGELWALDWWFDQTTTDKGVDAFIRMVSIWKPAKWWNEGGLIDKAIGPFLRRRMMETQKFASIDSLTSIMDKGAKLESFHARCEAGGVHFPHNRKWADRVIEQLVKFPGGRWDDAADVCGLIGRGLDKMVNPYVPSPPERKILTPFTREWIEASEAPDKPKVRYFS